MANFRGSAGAGQDQSAADIQRSKITRPKGRQERNAHVENEGVFKGSILLTARIRRVAKRMLHFCKGLPRLYI